MIENHAAPDDVQGGLLGSGRWKVDAEGSTAEFVAKTFWGLVTVRGHFHKLDGWLQVGPGAPDGIQGELNIEAASLHTGNKKRDKHLRSADFFAVEDHPTVSFKVARLSDIGGGRVQIVGTLEAAGKANPLELDASVSADGGELLIEGEASVDRRIFDMDWSPLGLVKTEAKLHVEARLDPA